MREDADFSIGEDHAAQNIVLQIAFDRAAERLLHETAPGLLLGGIDRNRRWNFSRDSSGSSIVSHACSAKTRASP